MRSLILALMTVSTIACPMITCGDDPFDSPANQRVDRSDPFAAEPLTDRFRWKEQLSVSKTLVSGSDLVSKISADSIILSSGNEFVIDEETTFVHQTPGQPTKPASVSDVTVGTPISFEIDLQKGAAARRVVVWRGFGPPGHKIYNDRLRKILEPLRPTGIKPKRLTLQHPAEAMTVRYASKSQTIQPGEPELIQFETPQKNVEVVSGNTKDKIEFAKPTSRVIAFRSFGSNAMIVTFEER